MDITKIEKIKELRSKMEGISIKFCKEALEKSNYDLKLAEKLLQEQATEFNKNQESKSEQKQKFGIVSIKEKEGKIVAFLLTYTDPSIPSDNKQFQETSTKIENILLDNFSTLYKKNN